MTGLHAKMEALRKARAVLIEASASEWHHGQRERVDDAVTELSSVTHHLLAEYDRPVSERAREWRERCVEAEQGPYPLTQMGALLDEAERAITHLGAAAEPRRCKEHGAPEVYTAFECGCPRHEGDAADQGELRRQLEIEWDNIRQMQKRERELVAERNELRSKLALTVECVEKQADQGEVERLRKLADGWQETARLHAQNEVDYKLRYEEARRTIDTLVAALAKGAG